MRFFSKIEALDAGWSRRGFLIFAVGLVLLIFLWLDIKSDFGELSLKNQRAMNYGREMMDVLDWLKQHSAPDDVVLTEWTEGNVVIAVADRSVVATSKVYPSEAKETAQRYKDLKAFFFAENEKEALAIVEKYKAKWIYLRKKPDIPSILKGDKTASQRYVIDKQLTPEGVQKTVIGRLLARGEFSNFQLALDSPDFLIYRVKPFETTTLTTDQRLILLSLARKTMAAKLAGGEPELPACGSEEGPVGVDVAIYVDGQLRGSQIVFRKTLEEATMEAAKRTIEDARFAPLRADELPKTTIEIYVFGDRILAGNLNYSASRPPDYFGRWTFMIRDEKTGQRAYFLPAVFNKIYFKDLNSFFSKLCVKGGLGESCYKEKGVDIFVYDGQSFAENSSGGLINYEGVIPLNDDSSADSSPAYWKNKLSLAAGWLKGRQLTYGSFKETQDPLYGDTASTEKPNLLRNGFSARALLEAYRTTGNQDFLFSAKLALDFLNNGGVLRFTNNDYEVIKDGAWSMGNLNFLIFANLEAFEQTKNKKYLQAARAAGVFLSSSLDQTGAVFSAYGNDVKEKEISDIFGGQAITALAHLARITGENGYREAAIKAADFYQSEFRSQRRLKENEKLSLASKAWLVNGFAELYRLTEDARYASFGLEVGDWLVSYQRQSGPAAIKGSFPNTPEDDYEYTAGTGKTAEALVDAAYLARELGWSTEKYENSLKLALDWLSLFQYRDNGVYFFKPEIAKQVIGGLRQDHRSPFLRADYAGHYIVAIAGWLNILAQK